MKNMITKHFKKYPNQLIISKKKLLKIIEEA